MPQPSIGSGRKLVVDFSLPEDLAEFVAKKLNSKRYSSEAELLCAALRQLMAIEPMRQEPKPSKEQKKKAPKPAPLDDFLPLGADPFAPVRQMDEVHEVLDFNRISKRMCSASIPKILR